MAQVDFAERQLTLKLVYYGPPLSGKTSNLRALHGAVDKLNRGRLMTLDTRDDRTLFFDLLPIFFRASGFSFRIKVYTVPGQPVHEATRKVVLAGSDGVVFVADSRRDQREANRASWKNLVANMEALGIPRVPVVVQYNKRDLPDAMSLAELDRFDDAGRTIEEASAKQGHGVVPTFFAMVGRAWDFLDVDLRLADKLGIDSAAFRKALAEHIGVQGEPGRILG
ncbi:MAG: GTPase domain-containing protein [Deltaproteobacteria bacterium]|nr:GTPase domain-containing protein [Deltaproteobacteria bacterium]MCW5804302.1 GTPase domain-containing protein [Deltaproteobacteria bacterium]